MNLFPTLLLLACVTTLIILFSPNKDTAWLRKSNLVLDAEQSTENEDPRDALLAKVQEIYPDPSLRIKSSGPRELFLATLSSARKDSSVTDEETIGNFFFDLLHDQAVFDAAVAMSGAVDGKEFEFLSKGDDEDLDPLERKLAELTLDRVNQSVLTAGGFDVEHEKRRFAGYFKQRVMPTWFADHREELCDMLGISELDEKQSRS